MFDFTKYLVSKYLVSTLCLICFSLVAFPQDVGPMGFGNQNGTATPAGPQPRLLLWLDGSSAQPFSAFAAINSWNDKSGNGHHFNDASPNKPDLILSGPLSAPGNNPCLRFPSSSIGRRLTCDNFELAGSGYTIYFVAKTNDEDFGLFSYRTPSSEREMTIYHDDSGVRQEMINLPSRESDIGLFDDNVWNYGGIAWSSANEFNSEYTGGEAFETGFPTFNGISYDGNGSAVIGDIEDAGGGYSVTPRPESFEGFIAEIFIFEGRVSRPITRLLSTYLWVKYGIQGDSPANNWDKFNGNYSSSTAAKYYAPIGIGVEDVGINGGSINEARSDGLVLRVNSWNPGITSYLCAAPVGSSPTGLSPNSPTTNNLTGTSPSAISRWSRLWEISGIDEGDGSQIYDIAFDFGEGISGTTPQNKDNFVLLYRDNPTSGNFSVLPVPNSNKSVVDDELVFKIPKSDLLVPGSRYYTLGTTSASSSVTGEPQRTWYAYQSGDWSDPLTWTLDGSAAPVYVNPGGTLPGSFDNVYIGSGRTVTLDTDISSLSLNDLTVIGTFDVGVEARPEFSNIAGKGLILCADDNFPLGNSSAFADPLNGGTLEFYGVGGFDISADIVVNNLKINMSSSSALITLISNLETNGLFEVNQGNLQINNNSTSPKTITSNGNVLIESDGNITVSNANSPNPRPNHSWFFYGDFVNNGGEVRFTNRSSGSFSNYSNPENQDFVTAFFSSSSSNQVLRANGVSNFSRIVVDKGFDKTYVLSISSNNSSHFKLLGPCDFDMSAANFTSASGNPNSFALVNGTAEIKENIFIPLQTNQGGIYNINNTAELWVNGGEVTKGPLGGSGTGSAIVPYGNIRVTAGTLNASCSNGITLRENALVQIDGGEVNTNVIRTSFLGAEQIGGIIINGGVVNVDGTAPGQVGNDDYYTFCLSYPGNLFRMTGGILNITGPSTGDAGAGADGGLIFINSDPQNTSVSGGTINLIISDNSDNHRISSRAAFWNLNLSRSISSGSNHFRVVGGTVGNNAAQATMTDHDLIVRNNFSITGPNSPTLKMEGDPVADLYVHGNLEIGSGCVYQHNLNTTHFVGSSNSALTFGGSTAFEFFNVEVNKDFESRFVNVEQTGPIRAMDILGNFSLEKGYFDNNNRSIDVRGNFINRTQFGQAGTSWLRMNGTTGRQEIISDGGVIYYLRIDNADGVTLKNDGITIRTRLTLDNGSFFIGDNKLRMETTNSSPISSFNGTDKFIVCSGNASAGGVEILNHSASQTINYPIGVSTGSGQKYTLANVYINSGWTDDGFIRIAPVDTLLSTSDISGTGDYLNFYWKVSSSEYDTSPNVTHRFKYDEMDVRGSEASFESARVLSELPFTRNIDNTPASGHINFGSNLVYYNGSDQAQATTVGFGTPLVDADYTAGAADRFPAGTSPDVFFSRSATIGAAWEIPGNWNKGTSHSTASTASTLEYPQEGDIAIIGYNEASGGRPHVYKAPPGGIEATEINFTPLSGTTGQPRYNGAALSDLGILRPTLQISATQDIIKVAQISGEGELWLENDIDLGVSDLGGFLSEDSSVVVLNTGNLTEATFNFLPSVIPNLFLAHTNATISTDVRIRGNLEIAGTSRLSLSENLNGDFEIDGDLILDQYQLTSGASPRVLFNKRGILKTIEVHGNVKLLGSNAYIGINTTSSGPIVVQPWTPDEIGAFLWFDAQDATTVTPSTPGSNVSSWDNKASASFNATQAISGNQPEYLASGINGHPTLRFDGSDFLTILHDPDLNLLAGEDFEIFSVARLLSGFGNRLAIYAKGQTSPADFLLYHDINRYRLYVDKNQLSVKADNILGSNANMGWARRQGNGAFMFNTIGGNATDANVSSATNAGNTHNVTIGAADDGATRLFDGDIAEIILIKRSLTDEERERMEGYLAHRWELQDDLPNGHPFKNSPPFSGIVGNEPAQLVVDGDIIQNLSSSVLTNNGIKLYDSSGGNFFVDLILTGEGNHEFDNQSGPLPRLWSLTLNKGIDLNSGFTFNSNVSIEGPSDDPIKSVNIQNGLLKFNDPGISITLSSGGGDFRIPGSAGLELNDGTFDIKGNETGLLLSGELHITGGSLVIGGTENFNNYIEYGGGSSPKIIVSDGSLLVGSQIRRNLSSTGGALTYQQSGGDVIVGRYSAPESNRGMLEVLNAGSRFDHTGGSLTFVRGVNLGSSPSLLIDPDFYDVGESSEIIIGNTDSPGGAAIQNFGIQSTIPLSNLTINSTNNPVVNLLTNDLELSADLIINSGATLLCGERNLTVNGDILNDGTLSSASAKVIIQHPLAGNISGTGVFDLHDFERVGTSGLTTVETNLIVNNDFFNDSGELSFDMNSVIVLGDVTNDGVLSFTSGSEGLVFSGSENQLLRRTGIGESSIDILSINNSKGVTVPAGSFTFNIDKELKLERGIFALTGNLLEMETGAIFTPVNPFSENNMIVTGGSFANFGVLVNIPSNTTSNIFVPLGIDRYMPVNLDFSQPGYSSGSTDSKYLVRLNLPENGVVIQDTEPVPPQINDLNNVLGMFFSVDGTDIGNGLNVDLKFRYDDQYVQFTSPYDESDYIAARVLSDNTTISKLGTSAVNETTNTLTFNIQGDFAGDEFAVDGDFFAGIDEAIPNTILVYSTDNNGFVQVDDGANGYDQAVPGGGAPAGALVIVESGDVLNFNIDEVNFYRTVIEAGALLRIQQTSLHRLGRVTGSGTLLVSGTGNLPAGDYTDFLGCPGGKLIYESLGGQSFEVLSNMPPIDEVSFFGPGEMIISGNEVIICNDCIVSNGARVKAANSALLTVNGIIDVGSGELDMRQGNTLSKGDFLISGSQTAGGEVLAGNNGSLTVEGDLFIGGKGMSLGTTFRETYLEGNMEKMNNPPLGSIQDGTGGAKLILNGDFPQTITGDFAGNSLIPAIELENSTGLIIDGTLEVSESLLLTDGNIFTDDLNTLRLTEETTQVTPEGGKPTSFVEGPMEWVLPATPTVKKFPIGVDDRHRPLAIGSRTAARTWTVQYYDTIARVEPSIGFFMLPDPLNIPVIETVSSKEYWKVDTDGSAQANIGLSWGDESFVSTNTADQSKLVVLAYDEANNHWDSYEGIGFTYDAPTNAGSFMSIDPVSFSTRYFTLGSTDELNPLPVTWLYFRGENQGTDNLLSWATASEQNNDYFELERSLDGSNWVSIARVTAAGSSNTTTEYTYLDQNAPFGISYYRLRQVDFDGQLDFAPNVVNLERGFLKGEEAFDFLLYPNPTGLGSVRFRISNVYDARARVWVSDLSGKLLSEQYVQVDGQGTSAPIDCNFEPGIYLITVILGDKIRSKPVVIN